MGKTEKKTGGSFVKMAAVLAAAGLIVRVIGFLYRLPLTNMIGDEGNGIYAAGYNIYNFFLIMSSAGLPVAISRMVAEKIALGEYGNARKIFRVSMLASGGLSLVLAILMAGGTYIMHAYCLKNGMTDNLWYSSTWCLYSLAPTIFIVGIMAVYRGYFQGFETTVPTALSQIVEQVFNAFFSVFLAWLWIGEGVEFGAAGGTAGTGVGALSGLVLLMIYSAVTRKSRNKIFETDKKNYRTESGAEIAKRLVLIAVPVITGTAIFSMTNFVDMAMVQSRLAVAGFDPTTVKALYGQLNGKYVTLVTMPVSISYAIATAVIPSIAASVTRKEKALVESKMNTALRLTMIISIPAACGLGVLGSPILKMLFPKYSEGGTLITVGALSVVFLALAQISTGVLQGIGNVKDPALNSLWGALTKIPLNYFLIAIPWININGAVISTTVCYGVCSVLNIRKLSKETGAHLDYMGMLVKPAIAAVLMGIVCFGTYKGMMCVMPVNTIATLVAIVVAVVVYFVAMILVRGFTRDDLAVVPMGGRIVSMLEKIKLM